MEDYHSMKRKELQALCKKHNIPANFANSVLADKLSQLLNVQEKQKPKTRQRACLKSQVETTDEGEPIVSKREAKKVRFSPTNVLVEYELESVKKQQDVVRETGVRRKSVAKKVGKPVVDNDNRVEIVGDAVQIPVKLTRSRGHILEKDDVIPNVGKRQGRSAVKDVVKGKDVNEEPKAIVGKATRSKVHGLGNCGAVQLDENKQSKRPVKGDANASESVEEHVVRARVTRSKAQTLMDADMDPDVKPQLKKKSGRQVARAAQLAEPAKEVVDIPVRTTRTRGQTLKEDIGDTVTKPQAEKKRTRREMKATDQSSNSSNVVLEDNQELPKRKSLRTREVKVEDEDEGDKVQMVGNRGVTRSRVTRSSKSKTENKVEAQRNSKRVQQLEEPLEPAVKKNVKRRESAMQPVKIKAALHLEETVNAPTGRVTRRKSIMQKAQGNKGIGPEKTEVVLHLEEPVSGPAGRITRRKSPMQKAQSKATEKPPDGKSEPVKETEIPDSPKTVGRNQSKRQSGSLSVIGEGIKDKENVIRSGKDALKDKMKAVANSTISPKSKKRRGTPIIEDGPVEAEYVSLVESSRRSMRGAGKSEGKEVTHPLQNSAKYQLKSGLKTFSSGGAVVRDGSSKKRAKLSVMKQSESEDHGEKSNIERTPISKLVTFELDERVIENEHTPAIDGSHRRFTRSASESNRKEPRQPAIKEQPTGDVQLSSHKVPKFRHDSAVKTAPGRVTRSGIKHAGNVASGLSERFDKKKQQCESAHQRKPFDDLQMSSHEVAESRLIPDVTIGAQSEIPKEVTDQILEHAGDISASESARLPAEVAKESKSETAVTMESLSSLFDEEASGVESPINFEVETSPGTRSNVKTSSETAPDAISDGSNVQNQVAHGKSAIFSEAEVQVALNAAESVLKSGRPEANEKELANLGSTSKGLQSDVGAEESVVSACMTVANLESADLFGDADFTCDAVPYNQAFEQPDIKSKSEGEEGTEKAEEGTEKVEEGERGSAQKQVMQEPVSEDNNVHGNMEKLQSSDMANRGVSDGELDGETNNGDTVVQLTAGDELVGLSVDEDDTKDDIVTAHDSLAKQNELSMGKEISFGLDMDRHGAANDLVDTVKEPTLGLELEAVPSTIDVCEVPNLCESDGVGGNMPSHGEDHVPSGVEGEDEAHNANSEHESNPKPLADDNVCDTSTLGIDDEYNVSRLSEPDPSSASDILETPLSGKDSSFGLATETRGVDDNLVDAGKEPAPEPEFEVAPSTANDVHKMPSLRKPDGVDGGVNATRESDGEDLVLSGEDGGDDDDSTYKEHESNSKPLINDGVSDTSVLGKDDYDNITRLFEPTLDPSSANDIVEAPISGDDICSDIAMDRSGVADTGKEHAQEHEFELAPSAGYDVQEMLSLGESDCANATKECETESTGGNMPSDGEHLVLSGGDSEDQAYNTNKEHESKLKRLTDDDVSGTSVLGKDDDYNITRLGEPTSDPSSANDLVEAPISGDDICSDIAMDRSGIADTGKEHAQENEFELAPSAGNDVQEMLSLGESDCANAAKERETESTGGNMPSDGEHLVLSGGDGEDQAYNTNKEHESKLKLLTDDDVSDTSVLGKDDDCNITRLGEPTSDPSSANDIVEAPISVNDIFGESDNAIYDQKSPLKPVTDNDDVEDGVNNGPKELESGLEPSVTDYSPNVPVLGNNAYRKGQDGEPEHEHEILTRIDMCATGEQFVGGVGSEPDQNENMPVVTEDLIRSTMAVDAREESLQDIDKDAVSDYFGDIYGLENAMGVTDTENDNWNEQKVTRTSEPDESAFSKGNDSISHGRNIEQITAEAELTTESDHALLTTESDHALSDKKEQLGTTIEHNLDSGKSMDDCSNSVVEMLDSRLVGDIKVQETPTREEITVGYTLSDAPTSLEEHIRHKQEKTQKENTLVDWGNYSFRMDGFQKLVSANENDDLLAKSTKDDQVSDLQSSARASSSIQESSSLAAEFVDSVNKLEHSSRNMTDRESDQDVDLLKGNANMLEEDFNWSDSPLKSLFTTPAASRISHVKGGREHSAGFSTSVHYFDHHENNDFNGENTQGNATSQENEMCGVPNFEHFSNECFEDEEVDDSIDWLGKNKHIEFKGDQYDLSSEAARTGNHHESSGLNVNSTHSGVPGEKETQLKGSGTGDDLAFDKGM